MDIKLLNFYFKKIGFKTKSNKSYLNYIRNNYEVKLFISESKALIYFNSVLLYETGIPSYEPSIVKWCSILINKHEKESNQIDSEY